ncbi:DUF7536 family protein [Natronomonas sp.]|uniref:DUF7536 family protein n=1 Tax=Natronomonas sp. TaxID=2184060 RepID=UPI002FC2AAF4
MSADRPDRPGVAALVAELEVRRHARTALAVGVGFAAVVFLLFAYLPGTDESLAFWAGLSFVLAFSVFGLVATVLVGIAAYRRTLEVRGREPGRRSPSTLAIVFGLLGWVLVPVVATLAVDVPSPEFRLAIALLSSGFVALTVGGIGVRAVGALTLEHVWRPPEALVGAVVYTTVVAAPAVGCPSGGICLGTPDSLVAATVGLQASAAPPAYAVVALGGGAVIGLGLGLRGASPPHGFFAGAVAALSVLPIVAAASGEPDVVRSTALYLPVVLGGVAAVGNAAGIAASRSLSGD